MTSAGAPPAPTASGSWRGTTAFWWLALSALAIAVFAPLPYLTSSLRELASNDSGLADNYVDRAMWVRAALYVHIVGGGVALALSPLQFARRLRSRAPRLHRVVGRVAFGAIAVGGVAGLVIAPVNEAGLVGVAGFGALGVLWLWFAWRAYRAIRTGDVGAHRRWAVRTFAMTYAAVMLRLWLGVLIGAQIGLLGTADDLAFDRAYLLVPFLCWVPNLIVAERRLARTPTRTGVHQRPRHGEPVVENGSVVERQRWVPRSSPRQVGAPTGSQAPSPGRQV
ncbi:MAG: DUF2306 domain-containing protein [Actinomycetota bacterium]|nr:DUF2306 domain-containing protein [Actinomycetota bacterium]